MSPANHSLSKKQGNDSQNQVYKMTIYQMKLHINNVSFSVPEYVNISKSFQEALPTYLPQGQRIIKLEIVRFENKV